jgi:hypothetical protein
MIQTKKNQAVVCWAKDCIKVGKVPSFDGRGHVGFLMAIQHSMTCTTMHEYKKTQNQESRKQCFALKFQTQQLCARNTLLIETWKSACCHKYIVLADHVDQQNVLGPIL